AGHQREPRPVRSPRGRAASHQRAGGCAAARAEVLPVLTVPAGTASSREVARHGAHMIPESTNPGRDYPQMAAERGRIEPAPRRVRGYFDNTLVFDTTRARYVWEVPYYPQYYIPLSDVRMEHLLDEDHPQKLQLGPSRLHSLTTDRRTGRAAAR